MRARSMVMIASAVAFAALAATPGRAEAADHSWTGGAPAFSGAWSNTANWTGGSAPVNGETIGTLSFPQITNPACSTNPPTLACGSSFNDLSGLQVGTLAIDDSLPTQGDAYLISGNGITLTGGLVASPAGASTGSSLNGINVPIALGAPQTWTVAGSPPAPGQGLGGGIVMGAPVTGQAHALTIHMSSGVLLGLSGDNEVGPLSIFGTAPPGNGAGSEVQIGPGPNGPQAALNATDGNPVTLTSAVLLIQDAAIGPITVTNVRVTVGLGLPPGTVSARAVHLDAASTLTFTVSGNASTAGADYSQLRSTGDVSLRGAHLEVNLQGSADGRCPAPRIGTVYTLVSTTAKLTGAFQLPDGSDAPIVYSCGSALPSYALQVAYHEHGSPQTVTATVVPAPPPGVRPGLAGAAPVNGVVLVRRRSRRTFTRLRKGALIPAGSEIETRRGRVIIFAAANAHGGVDSAQLFGGRFIVRQTGPARPRTTFALSQPLTGCRSRAAGATTARHRRRHRKRRIWVTEQNGRFNTRAQLVGTSVQGTTWLTADTCGASRVRVRHGVVVVHDFVHHRTIKLHGGQSVTVRRRG